MLWGVILEAHINGSGTLLSPKEEALSPPMFPNSDILDRCIIDPEIIECTKMLKPEKPNYEKTRDIKRRVFATYGKEAPPY